MPDFNEYRYGDLEFRQTDDGLGVVTGTIIRYGDVATLPWGTEEVKAGAFGDVEGADLIANRMHQRAQPLARTGAGLRIVDSTESMRAEVTLPDTSIGRDTAYEVTNRILRGLSLEFRTSKDTYDETKNHRVIERGTMYGFGVVDRPAYPGSTADMKRYLEEINRSEFSKSLVESKSSPEDLVESISRLDDRGRLIVETEVPFSGGYDEERQSMPRLRGSIPYNTDGVVSMARNEIVRFLPGAFTESLGGEILALVGNNYDDPLGGTAQRSLDFDDSEEALTFRTSRIPDTSVNRDFVAKLRAGFVAGITAGWALQGAETEVTPIEGGGNRITVRKAMLCELRFRTRSAFPGTTIQASRRNSPILYRAF